jgi:hypothetical protein
MLRATKMRVAASIADRMCPDIAVVCHGVAKRFQNIFQAGEIGKDWKSFEMTAPPTLPMVL